VQVDAGLSSRRANVIEQLRTQARWVVALSGGVDSAVLLGLTAEALGSPNVVAVTGRSPAVTDAEISDAAAVARRFGVRHEVVATREMDNPRYVANGGDRCFHCRTELFGILRTIALELAPARVAYGAIVDDLGDDRPGMAAAEKYGIAAPLLAGGLSKADVRVLASTWVLDVADKPANACLASRIPKGVPVTTERLAQVARAETALRTLGFPLVRVRHHGDQARIEVPFEDIARLRALDVRPAMASAGFARHAIDPEGYRPAGTRQAAGLYSIEPQPEGGQ
jgi:uncharacterized protein